MNLSFPPRFTATLALIALCTLPVSLAHAQPTTQTATPQPSPQKPTQDKKSAPAHKPDKLITPQQAKELFASVDTILHFDSKISGLPIEHPVKRKLTSRADVQKYLESQLKNGKSARRMLRSAIVLKKFGLLPQNFDLGPFMVKLLKEQIAGYYNSKNKTVYLLNWVAPDAQKPILAHELMHALQDQHVNLQKWSNKSLEGISHNVAQDNRHIRTDEDDTARQAVLEGQAMVTYVDYALRPHHVTIADNPDFMLHHLSALNSSSSNSPVMNSAPRVLRESLVFPYSAGLRFEIELIRDLGKHGAFAGALDNPPSTSYQIMHPRAYEQHVPMPILTMPNVHPLLDPHYKPYDIGVMGDLDAKMLLQLTTTDKEATRIASQWDGGIYYVARKKHVANPKSTASVALFYLSRWRNTDVAQAFAKNYQQEIRKEYPHASLKTTSTSTDHVYSTHQGPVLITTSGRYVFVSESFPLKTARKLNLMLLAAQHAFRGGQTAAYQPPFHDLTGNIRDFAKHAGILRCELPIAARTARLEAQRKSAIYTGISVDSQPSEQ